MGKKENHGLPKKLKNGLRLQVETFEDYEKDGYTEQEFNQYFGDGSGSLVKLYSYVDDSDDPIDATGEEYADGRLAVHAIDYENNCSYDNVSASEEEFVHWMTLVGGKKL